MYKFKTISLKDWKYAGDEQASERTKIMRYKKLAIRALEEASPFWFPKGPKYKEFGSLVKYKMGDTYNTWYIRPFGKLDFFVVHIEEAKIWIKDEGDELNQYPCGEWGVTCND